MAIFDNLPLYKPATGTLVVHLIPNATRPINVTGRRKYIKAGITSSGKERRGGGNRERQWEKGVRRSSLAQMVDAWLPRQHRTGRTMEIWHYFQSSRQM